ncbi:hypothetical protein JCM10450v2_000322 [Rhodotorula kratochvilovae]
MTETYNVPLTPAEPPAYSTVLAVTPEQMERVMAIRYKVFVEEQGYPASVEQRDTLDPQCDHLLMTAKLADGTVADVGTLRFYPPKLKLGRVAVLPQFRGGGTGKLLVGALEEHVRERRGKSGDATRGKKAVQLLAHAQMISLGFYGKTGWSTWGPEFIEEGQPHVRVVKRIELVPEPTTATLEDQKKPDTYHVRLAETQADVDRCIQCRIAVFVDEQGYSMEDELDEKDPESDHFIMFRVGPNGEEEDAGTIRWWPKPGKAAGKMGRVCVLPKFRGGGTGKILIQALEEHLRARKGKAGEALKGEKSVKVLCHSQLHAEGFYARTGYVREGGQFMEDGAPHCLLVKEIELVDETA